MLQKAAQWWLDRRTAYRTYYFQLNSYVLQKPAQVWLERRTAYTRATGVMSMVGYLLGLGDRHPSNLMLDRYSGKLLHIDFGDCFEASMHREKFPEKVRYLMLDPRASITGKRVCTGARQSGSW